MENETFYALKFDGGGLGVVKHATAASVWKAAEPLADGLAVPVKVTLEVVPKPDPVKFIVMRHFPGDRYPHTPWSNVLTLDAATALAESNNKVHYGGNRPFYVVELTEAVDD